MKEEAPFLLWEGGSYQEIHLHIPADSMDVLKSVCTGTWNPSPDRVEPVSPGRCPIVVHDYVPGLVDDLVRVEIDSSACAKELLAAIEILAGVAGAEPVEA